MISRARILSRSIAAVLAVALAAAVAVPSSRAQGSAPARPRSAAPDPRVIAAAAQEASLRHYLQGVLLENEGDLAGAIDEIGRAFSFDPASPDLAVKLADLSLQAGNAAATLEYARRATALGDTTGRARLLAGNALASMGMVRESLAEFQRATEEDSTRAAAWLGLGRAREETGDEEGATAALRRAWELSPDDIETAWRLAGHEARVGNYAAADSLLDRVEEFAPRLPGVSATRGWIAERQERYTDAVAAYNAHLEQFPTDLRVRRQLLQVYARLDDRAGVRRESEILLKAQPDDLDVARLLIALDLQEGRNDDAAAVARALRANNRGQIDAGALAVNVLGFTGKEGEARKEADLLTREAPDDYRVWLFAAETWAAGEQGGKKMSEVDQRYATAERIRPDSLSARVVMARSYARTGRHEQAEAQLTAALALAPNDGPLWLELAFAHERQKNIPEAEAAARKALALDPRNPEFLNFLGYLFADANVKLDEAGPLIQGALDADPRNPHYIDSMGWLYFRQGRLEEARVALEQALELSGGHPEIHAHLGDVYRALGRTSDAKSQYEKGLQMDPTSPDLTRRLKEIR